MVAAYDPARLTVHNVPLAKPTLRCYDNHAAELESLALLGLDCESIITALATRGLAADFGKALMSHHEYVLAEASKVRRAPQPRPQPALPGSADRGGGVGAAAGAGRLPREEGAA